MLIVVARRVGQAGLQRRLARRRLAGARLENIAHDRLVDLLRRDAGALDRGADGDRAELGGRSVESAPPNLPIGVRAAERM